jgi:hypothetical protein
VTQPELVIAHESGHLAAAVVLNLKPIRAEITPGRKDQLGAVYWRLGDMTPELATRIAKMTLAGPAMDTGELPTWPLCETRSRDERLVSIITNHLGYDEPKYEALQDQVWDLTFTRPFKRAFIAAETLLRRFWVIDRRGLAIVEWAAETETEAERELELCAA